MRAYRSFGIPGIDMLCNPVELATAKRRRSRRVSSIRDARV